MTSGFWTDEALIKGIKTASLRDKALRHVFIEQDWKGLAEQIILKKGAQFSDAEDVSQNALIALDRNVRKDSFKMKSSLKTYFIGIVKNLWLKHLRDRKVLDELNIEQHDQEVESIDIYLISNEKKKYLDLVLDKIGKRCKQIIKLKQQDYSLEEIARAVGLSSSNMAKKEAYRCRLKLRKLLGDNPSWKDLIR